MPLILLPTTSGTGSEVTPVAVLDDPQRAMKIGIASPHLIPEIAICDPELTLSCPPGLTAASGADAMTHAIERSRPCAVPPIPACRWIMFSSARMRSATAWRLRRSA